MALINRISRLFQADFHAVLDRIEEPEQLLRQAVRDMEEELAASEQVLKIGTHEQQMLATRIDELQEKLAVFDAELDLCFASNKHELARGLVRKKLETQRLLKRFATEQADKDRILREQLVQLEQNRAALESLKQKAEVFTHRSPTEGTSRFDDAAWMSRELAVGDDEIEVAFLREQNARRAS
jgi:phage shock protein A